MTNRSLVFALLGTLALSACSDEKSTQKARPDASAGDAAVQDDASQLPSGSAGLRPALERPPRTGLPADLRPPR
jgi:hypothetical protein